MAKEETDGKTAAELQKALLDAERSGQFLYEELAPLWEQAKGAIESGEQLVSLYTSYIYLTRRHVDSQGQSGYAQVEKLFEEAIDIFNECFADAEEDPFTATLQLEKNYAYFLYTRSKKPEKAREIWRRLLNSEQWPYPWLEAISLERAYGDVEHARQLFYRALEAVTARQGDIFGKFVQFEREEGTREQLDAALEKINAKAAEVNARVRQQQYKQEKMQRIREEQHHKGPQQQQQKRRMPNAGEGVQRNGQAANQQKGPKDGAGPKEKRRKVAEGGKTQTREEDAEMAVDREEKEPPKSGVTFGTSSVPLGPMIPGMGDASVRGESVEQKMELSVAEQPQESTEQRVDIGRNSSEKAFAYSAGLEKNKLFVKNLHFKSTGEELKSFFAQYGDVRDARIVTKWNGHSKGCAYVEFVTDEGAAAALVGADEAQIHGRKINVYLSNPPARKAREQTANTEGTASEALGPTSSTEGGTIQSRLKTPAQPRKSHFAPRAAILAGGQRVGRGSNLALGGTISKAKDMIEKEMHNFNSIPHPLILPILCGPITTPSCASNYADCHEESLACLSMHFGVEHLSECDTSAKKALFTYPIAGMVYGLGNRLVMPLKVQTPKGVFVVFFVVDTGAPSTGFALKTMKKLFGNLHYPEVIIQGTKVNCQYSGNFNQSLMNVNLLGNQFMLKSETSLIYSPNKYKDNGTERTTFYLTPFSNIGEVQKIANLYRQIPNITKKFERCGGLLSSSDPLHNREKIKTVYKEREVSTRSSTIISSPKASEGLSPKMGLQRIPKSKVFVIGAGGIGYELLRNLALTGFKHITVNVLDSNDKGHVGKSKSEVASAAVKQFAPDVDITYYHDSIMQERFGVDFFRQFSLVLSALDNKAARSHVNRLCLVAGVPLIESGLAGYLGQVGVIMKGRTECYDCMPKANQKTYPSCTIPNTPTELIHCVVWAKILFNQLFGESDPDDDVSPEMDSAAVDGQTFQVSTRHIAEANDYEPKKLFDKLFYVDVNYLLLMADLWKERKKPMPIEFAEIIGGELGASGSDQDQSNNWSIAKWAEVFEDSVVDLAKRYKEAAGVNQLLSFDKDDESAMQFVAACANLRAHVFHIGTKSLFDIKAMAGNIIPAIGIVDPLVVRMMVEEAIAVTGQQETKCRIVHFFREVLVRVNLDQMQLKHLRQTVLLGALHMQKPDVMDLCQNHRVLLSNKKGKTDAIMDHTLRTLGVQNGTQLECDDYAQQLNFKLIVFHDGELAADEFKLDSKEEENQQQQQKETELPGPAAKKARIDDGLTAADEPIIN